MGCEMIIQIRGTSGSGKTSVMREVMQHFSWEKVYAPKRKKPLYYRHKGIVVMGHYEDSACGGCDTIGSAPQIWKEIQKLDPVEASVVLCEGLLLSEDVKWSIVMNEEEDLGGLRVAYLTTPVEECLRRIQKRRDGVGNTKPLNPLNTTRRVGVIEKSRLKLEAAGVYCRRCTSDQAPRIILEWLRLHAQQEF
jgi:hypothetical protein